MKTEDAETPGLMVFAVSWRGITRGCRVGMIQTRDPVPQAEMRAAAWRGFVGCHSRRPVAFVGA